MQYTDKSELRSEVMYRANKIRELQTKIMAERRRLSRVQRTISELERRSEPREINNTPVTAVYKYDSRPAPPCTSIRVDHVGVTVGKFDEQGRYDHVLQDVHVVDRIKPRVEKAKAERQARHASHGYNIFYMDSPDYTYNMAA